MEQNQQDYLTPKPYQTLPALPNATASLVLGILSIVICGIGVVLGIIGIVLANKDLTLYRSNPGTYSESSFNNTKTGRICSIIGIIVSSLFVIFYVVYMIWIFSMIGTFKNNSF
jgi:magnesium-transporting ATPase (P-type)